MFPGTLASSTARTTRLASVHTVKESGSSAATLTSSLYFCVWKLLSPRTSVSEPRLEIVKSADCSDGLSPQDFWTPGSGFFPTSTLFPGFATTPNDKSVIFCGALFGELSCGDSSHGRRRVGMPYHQNNPLWSWIRNLALSLVPAHLMSRELIVQLRPTPLVPSSLIPLIVTD